MDDPLGARSDCVDLKELTRWNLTQLPMTSEDKDADISPFPWRNDLNSKLILWCGDITRLLVHGIVNLTNERLDAKLPETEMIYQKGGPDLVAEIRNNVRICKTGEAKTTKGHKLPARFVIHTVGPRYNIKYITAAESALFSCYRSVLGQVREHQMKSVAIPCLHSMRRGYPIEDGAHIAIRTVRRFLEKYVDDVDSVIFVCNEDTVDAYMKILPLYFPRSSQEEVDAIKLLPEDIGNENGEPIIPERQIRIMDKPMLASMRNSDDLDELEQTIDLNKEFGTSTVVEVGRHPFAQMQSNPDEVKITSMSSYTTAEQRHLENKRRYERLLKRSRVEDLTDIAALKCIYRTGVDRFGRPVLILVGKHFPANTINMERALLYLIRVMEPIVESDYIIVYFHTQTSADNHPDMAFLKQVYSILDNKYRKNMKAFYIIHPTWWSKLATWFFTTFTASDIKNKVISMRGVQYLYGTIFPDQLDIPSFVINYDIEINGPRYYEPPNEAGAEAL